MQEVFIVAAVRTPFGRLQGALAHTRVDDMLVALFRQQLGLNPQLASVRGALLFVGNANQAGEDNRNLARQVALLAGLDESSHALTVNALCNSGLEAFISAAQAIRCGDADLAWVGASENMSRAPFVRHRFTQEEADTLIGWRFTNPEISAQHARSMVEIAEAQAITLGIAREQQDAYAYASRLRYQNALDSDYFAGEVVPLAALAQDEQHRCFSMEALERLPPLLNRQARHISLGNSARAGDGAVLLLLASAKALKNYQLRPLMRLVASRRASLAPSDMNRAAAIAAAPLLADPLNYFDCIEVSESFALQPLYFMQHHPQLNPNIINRSGGSISIGNPTAAGNLRLIVAALSHFQHQPAMRHALVAASSGLGLGAAIHLESEC